MNHIRKFSSYQSKKNPSKVVNESVLQVDDTYKVRVIVDVKKSFINSYVKKVEDNTQKKLRDFYSDMDIVEELVKHVVESGMSIESIPATILVGGSQTQPQSQSQPAQVQPAPQSQPQSQPETPIQNQSQSEPQAQVQTAPADDFEDVNKEEENEEENEEELPQ